MGRAHHSHYETGRIDEGYWEARVPEPKIKIKFACGDNTYQGWSHSSIAVGDQEPSCPKCSAAWAKDKLADAVGDRLRMEKVEDAPGVYKSLYEAYVDDAHVAYLAFEHGWGSTWRVMRLELSGEEVAPARPRGDLGGGRRYGFHSKEAALLIVLRGREQGMKDHGRSAPGGQRYTDKLRSKAELLADREAYTARQRAREIERRQEDARDEEDKQTAKLALESLWARRAELSNLERSGLVIVGDRYGLEFSKK